jgi:hypothetical protein
MEVHSPKPPKRQRCQHEAGSLEVLPDPAGLHILVPVTDISIAQALRQPRAEVAVIWLLLRDKTLPIRVATKTKTAETLVFAKFKYDQSMDTFRLRFIIVEEGASHASLVAARSSSIDE